MSEHEVVVAVATYQSKEAAARHLHATTEPVEVAGALVEKGIDGQLTIGAYHGLAMDLTCRPLLPGAAIAAINAPLGIRLLAPLVRAPDAWSGVAALVAHFWDNIPKEQLRTMSDLLEARQAAVVVVALDHTEDDVIQHLGNSATTICTVRTSADFQADYSAASGCSK